MIVQLFICLQTADHVDPADPAGQPMVDQRGYQENGYACKYKRNRTYIGREVVVVAQRRGEDVADHEVAGRKSQDDGNDGEDPSLLVEDPAQRLRAVSQHFQGGELVLLLREAEDPEVVEDHYAQDR